MGRSKYQIIHQNDFGYIALCNSCQHIHAELGSFMVVLPVEAFKKLVIDFNQRYQYKDRLFVDSPSGEKISVQVSKASYVTFSLDELVLTKELFDISNHFISALELINH